MGLVESTERKNFYNDKNYISFVVAYDGDIQKEIDDIKDASIFFIDDNFAILSIKLQNYMETIRSIKSIIYIELNGIYTLGESPVEDS